MGRILLLILLVISSSKIFSQHYLPLEVGNTWNYSSLDCSNPPYCDTSYTYLTQKIAQDTVIFNGKKFFYPVNFLWNDYYARVESSKVFIYIKDLFEEKEVVAFDFSSEINDTTAIDIEFNWYSSLYQKDTVEIFEKQTEVLSYLYSDWTDGEVIHFSKDFGIIGRTKVYHFGQTHYGLQACTIDGKTYGTFTSVEDDLPLAKDYILYQNYPNPFNPTTTISYSIPESQNVEIKVYDLLGNQIAELVNGYKQSGVHSVKFNAINLSSGIYFYRIKSGSFVQSKKLMVVK